MGVYALGSVSFHWEVPALDLAGAGCPEGPKNSSIPWEFAARILTTPPPHITPSL
jgi:hypothetical protein